MNHSENSDRKNEPEESSSRPPEPGASAPMSSGEWEKELADIKEDIDEGPEVPEKPVRMPTPPPGGFKVPSLEELSAGSQKESEPAGPEPPAFEEEEVEVEEKDEEGEEEEGEEEEEEEEPAASETETSGARSASVRRTAVRPEEIKTALAKTTKKTEVPAVSTRRPKRGKISILLSVLLFIVLAASVAAGYHFRAQKGVEYYIERLKSEDPAIQGHARDSLSGFGAIAVPGIEKLLQSESKYEALAAVDTLALIDSREAIEILMQLTTHADADIRKRALTALGERAAPQAFSNVEGQLSSPDHETRLCAIVALENFDPQKSVPMLLDLLDDEDWQIRREAARTLTRITGEDLGIPGSTSTPERNKMIRDRWCQWWQEKGSSFERPENSND